MTGPRSEPRPLRVVAIEPSGRLYGSEYCLFDVIQGTRGRCFDWSVISTDGLGFSGLLDENGIRQVPALLPNLHRASRGRKLVQYLKLLMQVRRLQPDLIYVNQAGVLRAAGVICRLLNVPGVCQVQTLEDARLLGTKRIECSQIKAFICNSDFIADNTAVPAERKCVLYQGVQGSPQYCPRHISGTGPLSLGIIGRISESKGHYLLLRAVALLRSVMRIKVRVIGEGFTAGDTAAFQRAVAEVGLQDMFEFRGYRRDLRTEFSALDLLLIPSLAEPLGRVLFDAAHFGVPAIVADSGGLGEIAGMYDVGERFAAGNAEDLASCITRCSENLSAVTDRFRLQSGGMIRSLDMAAYLNAVEKILREAAERRDCRVRWQGSPGEGL